MSGPNLRITDWEHRLHVLWAWRIHRRYVTTNSRDDGAIYRAILDGCAITLRALCQIIGVGCNFKDEPMTEGNDRIQQLLDCCWEQGRNVICKLSLEDQRCLLEVLYLGNRAVAHPKDGQGLDHKAGYQEMTSAINTVLKWLTERKCQWPELEGIQKNF